MWPSGRHRALEIVGLCGFGAAWLGLGLTVFRLGPSEWDDAFYCDTAATGDATASPIRNRFVHVWALRLLFGVLPTRQLAASALAVLMLLGIAYAAFVLGRKLGGRACAWLSLLLVPLCAPMLRYVSVPHVDLTMACFSLWALAAAVSARDQTQRSRLLLAAVSGAASFFAIESKETGLAVLPVVLYVLLERPSERAHNVSAWLAGVVCAYGVLLGLDASFTTRGDFSSNPLRYFDSQATSFARAALDLSGARRVSGTKRGYFELLTRGPFLAFKLLGLAAGVSAAARSVAARALLLYLLSVLTFSSLVGWLSRGIEAEPRYLIAPGAVLVVLAAHETVRLWRQSAQNAQNANDPSTQPGDRWLWGALLVLLGLLLIASFKAVLEVALGTASRRDHDALVFLAPLCTVVLFLLAQATRVQPYARFLARTAPALLLALAISQGGVEARDRFRDARAQLEPWTRLVQHADAHDLQVAVLRPPHTISWERVQWRVRALSGRPADRVRVRPIKRAADARSSDLVFAGESERDALLRAGFAVVAHAEAKREQGWAAYVRKR